MQVRKLDKIRRELEAIQASPRGIRSARLISIAKKLGRTKCKRGKEPTWVREDSPELFSPLSIPNHPGDMATGTVRSIVEALLSDVDQWKIDLETDEDDSKKDQNLHN